MKNSPVIEVDVGESTVEVFDTAQAFAADNRGWARKWVRDTEGAATLANPEKGKRDKKSSRRGHRESGEDRAVKGRLESEAKKGRRKGLDISVFSHEELDGANRQGAQCSFTKWIQRNFGTGTIN